ncbi:hypothetical protein SEEHRA36_05269 [Salmonella enterica subsp. enterica serovar Heidelberg str. SARA36]|nr:hypothetical protein SEEHRA36_05269 [Salmonella enterica subsp. enterica serovar Heidelberg str. SARA36]
MNKKLPNISLLLLFLDNTTEISNIINAIYTCQYEPIADGSLSEKCSRILHASGWLYQSCIVDARDRFLGASKRTPAPIADPSTPISRYLFLFIIKKYATEINTTTRDVFSFEQPASIDDATYTKIIKLDLLPLLTHIEMSM